MIIFNTKSDQGTFTPVGAQGGFHGTHLEKTTFPPEFCNEICTIYVQAIKIKILQKNNLNVVPFQNGGQITDFYFASFRFWPNFEKNTFPKEVFCEIWLKEGKYA